MGQSLSLQTTHMVCLTGARETVALCGRKGWSTYHSQMHEIHQYIWTLSRNYLHTSMDWNIFLAQSDSQVQWNPKCKVTNCDMFSPIVLLPLPFKLNASRTTRSYYAVPISPLRLPVNFSVTVTMESSSHFAWHLVYHQSAPNIEDQHNITWRLPFRGWVFAVSFFWLHNIRLSVHSYAYRWYGHYGAWWGNNYSVFGKMSSLFVQFVNYMLSARICQLVMVIG